MTPPTRLGSPNPSRVLERTHATIYLEPGTCQGWQRIQREWWMGEINADPESERDRENSCLFLGLGHSLGTNTQGEKQEPGQHC